jgi:hypothetical protein
MKILFVILFLVSCNTKDPCPSRAVPSGFILGAKVKIKEGFYGGHTGVLTSYSTGAYVFDGTHGSYTCYNLPEFSVKLNNRNDWQDRPRIELTNLELIK